jgi:prolyl-tRNA synthetase
VRRDTGVKNPIGLADIGTTVKALLDTIQNEMFSKAKATYDSCLKEVTQWDDVVPTLDNKCIVVMPWCEVEECEDDIKERSGRAYVPPASVLGCVLIPLRLCSSEPQDERAPSAGAKSLAIPFDQSRWSPIVPGETKCPACGKDAKRWTMFGRSY